MWFHFTSGRENFIVIGYILNNTRQDRSLLVDLSIVILLSFDWLPKLNVTKPCCCVTCVCVWNVLSLSVSRIASCSMPALVSCVAENEVGSQQSETSASAWVWPTAEHARKMMSNTNNDIFQLHKTKTNILTRKRFFCSFHHNCPLERISYIYWSLDTVGE